MYNIYKNYSTFLVVYQDASHKSLPHILKLFIFRILTLLVLVWNLSKASKYIPYQWQVFLESTVKI